MTFPNKVVRCDLLGGSTVNGCDKFASYTKDWDWETPADSTVSLAALNSAGYKEVEFQAWLLLPNFINYIDQFIANIYSGGLKSRINLEPAIEWPSGPTYASPPSYYEDIVIPTTPDCSHYGYYSTDDLQFNGDKQDYTPSYSGAETYTIDTLGDIITALNADPRIVGYSFEGADQNAVTWITDRAHESGVNKTVLWWLHPDTFCSDVYGTPQYPSNWNGQGMMGQNSCTPGRELYGEYDSTDIDDRMAMVDAVTSTLYYITSYGIHFSSRSYDESVACVRALKYLRDNYGTSVPLGVTSNTYRTHDNWWSDFGATYGSQTWTTGAYSNTCMGRDGTEDVGYLGQDGIIARACRWLYAEKMALGGKADLQVISNQSMGMITSMAEQIAFVGSLNLLTKVPTTDLTVTGSNS